MTSGNVVQGFDFMTFSWMISPLDGCIVLQLVIPMFDAKKLKVFFPDGCFRITSQKLKAKFSLQISFLVLEVKS